MQKTSNKEKAEGLAQRSKDGLTAPSKVVHSTTALWCDPSPSQDRARPCVPRAWPRVHLCTQSLAPAFSGCFILKYKNQRGFCLCLLSAFAGAGNLPGLICASQEERKQGGCKEHAAGKVVWPALPPLTFMVLPDPGCSEPHLNSLPCHIPREALFRSNPALCPLIFAELLQIPPVLHHGITQWKFYVLIQHSLPSED